MPHEVPALLVEAAFAAFVLALEDEKTPPAIRELRDDRQDGSDGPEPVGGSNGSGRGP
jgi:hypothetical protein